MFIENYRVENAESMMAVGEARPIPYPKICEEDWRVWSLVLPVRAQQFDREAARSVHYLFHGMPKQVGHEIRRASQYFDRIEIWRKRVVDKDPIAVGYLGDDRYLIARWGVEKLVPFEAIKKSMPLILAWKYGTSALGVVAGLAGLSFLVWNLLS